MSLKFKKVIGLISGLFLVGNFIVFIGLAKGSDVSSVLSRPGHATCWQISNELTLACTYVPVIIGISFILLSIIFATIVFLKWFKDYN